MVGILIKVAVGAALFVGSLLGGLAATGRLNHEGTANIPVLSSFFPAPEESEHAEGGEGAPDEHAAEEGGAHASDASSHDDGAPVEAAGQQGQGPKKRLPKTGPSFKNPEEPKSSGGHGGGHGEESTAGHADGGQGAHGQHPAPAGETNKKPRKQPKPEQRSQAERDFDRAAERAGKTGYSPGEYFQFGGMPAGVTPEQLNEAWQTVQRELKEAAQQRVANELKEAELKEFASDISRRQKALGAEQLRLEKMRQELDEKILAFEARVIILKDTEVQKLKRNAETMAAFERSKAAELIEQQWSSETGQKEIVRLLEVMDRDAVNEILAELPNPMVQDILKKRMQLAREATATGK
jgi:hypothetical protein